MLSRKKFAQFAPEFAELIDLGTINAPKINSEVAKEAMKIAEEIEPVVIRPWEWFEQ